MSDPRTLLPPSATALSRSIETVMAERTQGIEAPIGTLWHVDTCPVELLPWLAWAFSVEVWEHDWSEEIKRDVIRSAIAVHRLKGTRQSVEIALGALGFRIDLVEAWEEGGDPHTFRLDAYGDDVFAAGFQIDAKLLDTVTRLIENVKPVRSHFTLRIGESFEDDAYLRAGVTQAHVHRLDLDPAPRVHEAEGAIYARAAHRIRRRDAHEYIPAARMVKADATSFTRSGHRPRITSRITHDFQVREGAAYAV